MTVHSNDPLRRDRHVVAPRSNMMSWLLGALAVAALLGVVIWSMSDNTNVARTGTDINTGTATTRTAPTPQTPAAPATPARP